MYFSRMVLRKSVDAVSLQMMASCSGDRSMYSSARTNVTRIENAIGLTI